VRPSLPFSASFTIPYVCELTISELPCASVSKRVLIQNLTYENDFDLHENETVGRTHFHMIGFATESQGNLEMAY